MSKQVIDKKFQILAVNPCKAGAVYTEKDGVFFCARDAGLPTVLRAYKEYCMGANCSHEHIESIELLIERVEKYQETKKKLPDTETDCEIDRCIGGVGL